MNCETQLMKIAVLNHINWCLHSCHSCHKRISCLMSTRRVVSQPLLWRTSCALISVYNRAGSWLSSLTVFFFPAKITYKRNACYRKSVLRWGGVHRQGSIARRKQNISPGRKYPEQCRGCSTWNVKWLPVVSWYQMALLTLNLFASVYVITLLLFHLLGV